MNITLLWMLVIPIIGGGVLYYFNRETQFGLFLGPIAFSAGAVLIALIFGVSYGAAISDTEVLSGQITTKSRDHGTYEESYKCNCRSVTKYRSGSNGQQESYSEEECDTCYRTHYTVKWTADSTIGGFSIDSADETSRSVYALPDPPRYTIIKPGDPASRTQMYTNYVQAVPNSLFAVGVAQSQFLSLMKPYPDDIYDKYKIDRFMSPGFSFIDEPMWNEDISKMLCSLGPQKQVNAIVVIAKTADRQYVHALRQHWEGANKNDVVLVIGTLDGLKIEFVDVISWTKSEIFKVQLIDRIREIGIVERKQIIAALHDQIAKNFERRHMREFEYLKGEIDPPSWLLTMLVVLLVIGYGTATLMISGVALPKIFSRLTNSRGPG